MATQLYLLSIKINIGADAGVDLPGYIDKLRLLIGDYSSSTKCLYKFKVVGEARIVAVLEVSSVIALERTLSGLARIGLVDVTCTPLRSYENFACDTLGLHDNVLLQKREPFLCGDKQAFWVEFTVDYKGKSMDELCLTWLREATTTLTEKTTSKLELYKVVAERKVHAFLVGNSDAIDQMTFSLPMMVENGDNTTIVCHAILDLDNYSSKISSEHLQL